MTSKLIQVTARVTALEALADEVLDLAKKLHENHVVQPELRNKTERWYRGARELLLNNSFSGVKDFEDCYKHYAISDRRAFADIENYTSLGINPHKTEHTQYAASLEYFGQFLSFFTQARAILVSLLDEILSRELPVITQLSFAVVADEFDTAENIFESNKSEVMLRAVGVICRVALERHMHVLIESRELQIILNPPQKTKADFSDLLITLQKNSIITPVQKSELESLNKKGNNCAHPKEAITVDDVKQLIMRGKELCSLIL